MRVPGMRVPGMRVQDRCAGDACAGCVCGVRVPYPCGASQPVRGRRRLRAAARAPVPAVLARIAGGPRPAPPRRGCSSSSSSSRAGAACPGA
ncbi:hypothetical protein Nmel_004315, partial [Mimus melanotis]